MAKKFRCEAPIDNKNLMEDGFEDDVFQDLYAASDHRKRGMRHLIGHHREWGREFGGAIIEAKWHYGEHMVVINVLAAAPQEDFDEVRKEVFAAATDTFKAWQCDDNPDLVVETEVRDHSLIVSFYFETDDSNRVTTMTKYKIDLTCDEWYVADSLHELGARIENDDLLDEMQDGRVTVSGDHYTAEITETNEEVSECSDDPKEQLLERWSMTFKGAVLYARDQMDEDDLAILRAQVYKNYKQHNAPATGIDDSKVIDLLEEYGDDHDLPEGWYLDEYDADDVMPML